MTKDTAICAFAINIIPLKPLPKWNKNKAIKKYGQEHLLNHFKSLDESHKKQLLEEINNIDFELVNSLYRTTKKETK